MLISNQRPNSVVEFKNKKNIKTGISFDKNEFAQHVILLIKKMRILIGKKEKNLKKILSKYRKKWL